MRRANLIIGFSGKMGTGKNYIAEKLLPSILNRMINNLQYYYLSFGDQIKVELGSRDSSLTYDKLFVNKTKEVRQQLQRYGTEEGRDKYGKDIWIRSMGLWMDIFKSRTPNKNNVFIITDVRFKNEADWIRQQKGILIRVNGEKRNKKRIEEEGSHDNKNHSSETDLDDFSFEHVINNDVGMEDTVKAQLEEIAMYEYKKYTSANEYKKYMGDAGATTN